MKRKINRKNALMSASSKSAFQLVPFRPRIVTPMPPPKRPLEKHISLYVTYEEATGQKPSVGDLTVLLSQLNLNDVLRAIATINNLYSGEHVDEDCNTHRLQIMLARGLFSEDMRNKLAKSPFAEDEKTFLFHRHQQLYLLRHALMSCAIRDEVTWNEEDVHKFGDACLMVNSLLHSEQAQAQYEKDVDEDSLLSLVLMLLPMVERGSDHEAITTLGRANQLWLEIPAEEELKQSKKHMELNDIFLNVYGVKLKNFLHILTLLYVKVLGAKVSPQDSWMQFVINLNTTFVYTRYSKEELNKVMSAISYSLANMGNMLYSVPTQSRELDLTALERYPSIKVAEDVYVLYDRNLLIRFFTSGVWWLIQKALPEEKHTDFSRFFGEVFAMYIERVISHSFKSTDSRVKHALLLRPMFAKNDEVCDILITEEDASVGASWIMIETKASLLTTQAKYSGTVNNLQRDLDNKFASSKSGEHRGVTQLANSINKLAKGMAIDKTTLNFSQPKRIYPVLISYDIAVTGKFMAQYLDSKLRVALDNLPLTAPKIMPLTVLTMQDIEVYTSLAKRHLLSNLLASYEHQALPLMGFKDHIIEKFHSDVRVEESFSKNNYDRFTEELMNNVVE